MKLPTLAALLCIATSFLPSCIASPIDQPIVIYDGLNVNHLVDDIGFQTRFAADASGLMLDGYTAHWAAATGEIIGFTDEHGKPQHLIIFAVPFINGDGIIMSAIIGGIIRPDGGQPHDFMLRAKISEDILTPIISASADNPNKKASAHIDIKPLIPLIAAGRRSDISDYIIRETAANTSTSSEAIRSAFESNGYACSIAPKWFLEQGIWYAATCIHKAP